MLIGRCLVIIAFALSGCATPGDPSCAVYDEITDRSRLREVMYSPDLDPVGLHETSWYNCPTAWNPECPGVECRHCGAASSVRVIESDVTQRDAATEDEMLPPSPAYD